MGQDSDFIPPYSTTFVQRQFKIIQQRKQSGSSNKFGNNVLNDNYKRHEDVLESRCSNSGGSFQVHSANDQRVHHSQRTFGLVRPNRGSLSDNYCTSSKFMGKRRGRFADPKTVKKDNAASYAMNAQYNKLARSSAAKMSHRAQLPRRDVVDKNGVRLRDASVQDKPWLSNSRNARSSSVNAHVNPESSIKGNLKKSYASVHHWPGQITEAHEQDLLEGHGQQCSDGEGEGEGTSLAASASVYGVGPASGALEFLNQDAITLLRTPSANMNSTTPVPRYRDDAGQSSGYSASLARSVGNINTDADSDGGGGGSLRASTGSTSTGVRGRVRARPRPAIQHHVNSISKSRRAPANPLVDAHGHIKQHTMHYVKCVQHPMRTHSATGREAKPVVVSKLVCLQHDIHRDELVRTLEQQILVAEDAANGVHITDVTITYPINQYSYTSTLAHPSEQTAEAYRLHTLLSNAQATATRSMLSPQKIPDPRPRPETTERGLSGTGNTVSLALSTIPEYPELNNVDCVITVYTCPDVVLHTHRDHKEHFNNAHHVHTVDSHATVDSSGTGGTATPTVRMHKSPQHTSRANRILNSHVAPQHRYSLVAQSPGRDSSRDALHVSVSTPTPTQAAIKYNNNLLHINRHVNHSNNHHHSLNYFVPSPPSTVDSAAAGAEGAPMTIKEIIAETSASSSQRGDGEYRREQSVADVRLQSIRAHLRGSEELQQPDEEGAGNDMGGETGRVHLDDFLEQSPNPSPARESERLSDCLGSGSPADIRLAQARVSMRGPGSSPGLNTVTSRNLNDSAHAGTNTADVRLAQVLGTMKHSPAGATAGPGRNGATSGSADVRLAQARAAIRGEASPSGQGYGAARPADCNNTADLRLGQVLASMKGGTPPAARIQDQGMGTGSNSRNTVSNRAIGGSANSGSNTADIRLGQARRYLSPNSATRTQPTTPPYAETGTGSGSGLTPSPSVIDLRLAQLRQKMRTLIAEDRAMENTGGDDDDLDQYSDQYDGEPESEGEYERAGGGGYGWVEPATEQPERFSGISAAAVPQGQGQPRRPQAVSPISESSGSVPVSRRSSGAGAGLGGGSGNGPSPSLHQQFRQELIEPRDSEDDSGYEYGHGSPSQEAAREGAYQERGPSGGGGFTDGSDTSYIQEDSGDDDTEYNLAAELNHGRHTRDRDLRTRSAPVGLTQTPPPQQGFPQRQGRPEAEVRGFVAPMSPLSPVPVPKPERATAVATSLHTNNTADVRLRQVLGAMKSSNSRLAASAAAAAVDNSSGNVADIRLQQVKQQIHKRQLSPEPTPGQHYASASGFRASDGAHDVTHVVGINLPIRQQRSPSREAERDWNNYQLHSSESESGAGPETRPAPSVSVSGVASGSANVITYELDFDSLF